MPTTALGLEVVLNWNGGPGQHFARNVLHFTNDSGDPLNQLMADAIALEVGDNFISSGVRSSVSTGITLDSLTVRDMGVAGGLPVTANIAVSGTGSGQPLPPQIALVVSLAAAAGGRRGRGRIYTWGYTETDNDSSGQAVSGLFLNLIDMWVAIKTNLDAADIHLGVFSRADNVIRDVVSIACDGIWDSQRRRVS